jgi:DNA transformation protein and related proteins
VDPESIQDLFQEIGPIRVRGMFGAHGLYCGGQIFGLQVADEIYLKTDGTTRLAFEKADSRPFRYRRNDGREVSTSYWLLPSSAVDDPSEAARWARMALEAARRATAAGARTKARR